MKTQKERYTIVDASSGVVLKDNILKYNINAWLSGHKFNLKEIVGTTVRAVRKK